MKLTLDCPRAKYGEGMAIYCQATGDMCAHQYFKPCKGWCVLSPGAAACPAREERTHGETDSDNRDTV